MGKKTAIFAENQHVYAKVRGFSPWPAKITKVIAKHRYGVYFYGTGETASVKSEDLVAYDEKTRAKYNTDHQLKKNDYKEAVDQIEAALNGNDPAPIITDEKITKNQDFSTDHITDNDSTADETQLSIAEETPKSTPQPQKKKPVVKADEAPAQLPLLEPETKENDEKVSRSGRKIKEKKMNLDEMDPDDMFQQSRKRFKPDEPKQKPAIVQQADSTSAIDEFRASKMHILQNPVKKAQLEHQFEMIHKMQEVRLALGLENADVDRSIELLESFRENNLPHITDLMLLKYPNTVDTVKRLRKYIGNFHSWDLETTQVQQFQENAKKIRSTASEIYEKIKTLFNFPDGNFWFKFAEKQKGFNEKYNVVNPTDLFEALDYEELDSFVNNRSVGSEAEEPQIPESLPAALL